MKLVSTYPETLVCTPAVHLLFQWLSDSFLKNFSIKKQAKSDDQVESVPYVDISHF